MSSHFLFVPQDEVSHQGASMVTGSLHIVENGRVIASFHNVITGGHGNGAIEGASRSDGDLFGTNVDAYSARYNIEWYAYNPDHLPDNMITRDRLGEVSFAVGLKDQHGRTDLAIHPENLNVGGAVGTLGCLAIPDNDARAFETLISNLQQEGRAPDSLYIADPEQPFMFSSLSSADMLEEMRESGEQYASADSDDHMISGSGLTAALPNQRDSSPTLS